MPVAQFTHDDGAVKTPFSTSHTFDKWSSDVDVAYATTVKYDERNDRTKQRVLCLLCR